MLSGFQLYPRWVPLTGLVWDTNIAAVPLFWDTNMAAVTLVKTLCRLLNQ